MFIARVPVDRTNNDIRIRYSSQRIDYSGLYQRFEEYEIAVERNERGMFVVNDLGRATAGYLTTLAEEFRVMFIFPRIVSAGKGDEDSASASDSRSDVEEDLASAAESSDSASDISLNNATAAALAPELSDSDFDIAGASGEPLSATASLSGEGNLFAFMHDS